MEDNKTENNMRWLFYVLLVVTIVIMFTEIDKSWAAITAILAFITIIRFKDRKEKEYLDKRIDEIEKRIDKFMPK